MEAWSETKSEDRAGEDASVPSLNGARLLYSRHRSGVNWRLRARRLRVPEPVKPSVSPYNSDWESTTSDDASRVVCMEMQMQIHTVPCSRHRAKDAPGTWDDLQARLSSTCAKVTDTTAEKKL